MKWNIFLRFKELILLVVIMGLATVLTGGMYLQPGNLADILVSIAPEFLMALGMTFVILTAGIDLSVGSILALASLATAALLVGVLAGTSMALAIPVVVLGVLLVGGLCGAMQGGLIAALDIQPFIITLAGMIGFRGLGKLLTNNQKIQLGATHAFPEWMASKPVVIGVMITATIICWALLRGTVFGRYVRAIGDNERAAVYAGLPVKRVKIAVYTLCGMLSGLAGMLICARTTVGNAATQGTMDELEAIAMVVIGGTSLMGGRGTIIGTVLGAIMIGSVNNVLGLNNVRASVQSVLLAMIIVLAVAAQMRRRRI